MHPPEAFKAFISPDGVPAFTTRFDLLTTAENSIRRRIMALPLHRHWCGLLRPQTCFIGTTVTEYALFPRDVAPDVLVSALKSRYADDYPFLIIKDLPQASPLLDEASNTHAREVAEACKAAGFALLDGQALAYVPIDFGSVESYISRLSSGRRKDIRRKLRVSEARAIETEAVPCGSDCFRSPAVLDEYYALYLNVFRQSEIHVDLLSAEFFRDVLQDATSGGIVFEYRHGARLIGYNVCIATGNKLIDKYVGFRYPEARELNLYFVSWFHNLA